MRRPPRNVQRLTVAVMPNDRVRGVGHSVTLAWLAILNLVLAADERRAAEEGVCPYVKLGVMSEWPPTPEEVRELPVDVIGIRLLRHVRGGKTVLRNVVANLRSEVDAQRRRQQVGVTGGAVFGTSEAALDRKYEQGLGEAWHWLIATGLLTEIPMEEGWFMVSRLGEKVLDEAPDPVKHVRAEQRIAVDLHPRIQNVRSQFLLGEYDAAVLIAMRTVEERVRELARAPNEEIGVNLMKRVFGNEGLLRDKEADKGEADAQMALFWGAIGFFKNPASHRRVHYEDATEASEAVLLADLLLRILDRVQAPT
jgi:uncharacterized protein (TIGR02391 family)